MAVELDHASSRTATGSDKRPNIICLSIAVASLCLAINERDGEYWPEALRYVTVGVAACAAAVIWPSVRDLGLSKLLTKLSGFGLVAALALAVFMSPPLGWFPWSDDLLAYERETRIFYYACCAVTYSLAASLALGLLERKRAWRFAVPIAVAIHLCLGVWLIHRAAPRPLIDVYVFQQEAAKALLHGSNPYAMSFDDIYRDTKPADRPVYAEKLARDGKVLFGFPYPPLSLYLSTLGYAVAGDHRYAQLLALAGAALLIGFARPGSWSSLLAILLLFAPRSSFVLCRGWTEPFAVLCLSATVFCAVRHRKLLPIALGLLLASKQYLVLALPLVPLLAEGPHRWRHSIKLALQAIAVAALVTAPLALWDPQALWHSLVTVQKLSPFREDALSYLVWYFQQAGAKPGVLPAFVAAVVAIALALWRGDRSAAGFSTALAMVCLLFISLNKQAFANYYSFVIGALWCAMAAIPVTAPHPLNETAANVR
jgi:hypothetical protein